MLTDPATVAAARAGDKDALVGILGAHYPQVWRMAINLTGRLGPGKEVARNIMRQSLSAAEGWEHDEAPTIWFRHHTVLATREAAPDEPSAKPPTDDEEVLLNAAPPETGYAAFARALRRLPQQQREAFLLNHGEDFDLRQLGIAMDCSVEAAALHLRQATVSLRAMAGDDFGRFVQLVRDAYRTAAPDEELSLPWSAPRKRSRLWGFLLGLVGWIVLLAVVSAIGYGLWWLWPRLVF
jgi:DNA-directed RNA polymerase specialized sigma24 family protein